MDEQPRLTDLVPLRLGAYFLAFIVGLGVIAGLEGLYAWMPRLAAMTTDGRVATIDLDGEGSLAVWFSTTMLSLAGLLALLVYAVRRHRRDDYQGRYRVWLWAAFCWFLMGLDETASLHEGFKEIMAYTTGARVFGDGSIWWVSCYFFLLAAVGTRLLIDMRECWLSSMAMLTTAACFALAVAAQLGFVLPESGAKGVMVEEGAEMVGDLFLLLAMGLHARHVILDAEGLLERRRRWRRPLSSTTLGVAVDTGEPVVVETMPSEMPIKVHPPRRVAVPATTTVVTTQPNGTISAVPAAVIPASAAVATIPGVQHKLSKSDRKALRRRLNQMRDERDRRLMDG